MQPTNIFRRLIHNHRKSKMVNLQETKKISTFLSASFTNSQKLYLQQFLKLR